jgi:transcriptional regulator with XRE-family HTH domain
MKTFGQLVLQGRRNLHLRLEDLASRILKTEGECISVTYLSDLEHDRRTPSEHLLPQFATALQVPLDLLYCSLGKLPPDIRDASVPEDRLLAAFQAFRQVLDARPVSHSSEALHPVRYKRFATSVSPAHQYDVVKDWKSGLFERRNGKDTSTAA